MVVCRIKPSFSVYIVCFHQKTREGCGCRELLPGKIFWQLSTLPEKFVTDFPARKMAAGKSAPPSGTLLDFLLWDRHSLLEFFWFQGFEGIFECVFLTLPYKPPEGQNHCNWTPKTLLRNASDTTNPLNFIHNYRYHPYYLDVVYSVWRIYSKWFRAHLQGFWPCKPKNIVRYARRIPKCLQSHVNIV